MGYDHRDSFSFDYEPSGNPLGQKKHNIAPSLGIMGEPIEESLNLSIQYKVPLRQRSFSYSHDAVSLSDASTPENRVKEKKDSFFRRGLLNRFPIREMGNRFRRALPPSLKPLDKIYSTVILKEF